MIDSKIHILFSKQISRLMTGSFELISLLEGRFYFFPDKKFAFLSNKKMDAAAADLRRRAQLNEHSHPVVAHVAQPAADLLDLEYVRGPHVIDHNLRVRARG